VVAKKEKVNNQAELVVMAMVAVMVVA